MNVNDNDEELRERWHKSEVAFEKNRVTLRLREGNNISSAYWGIPLFKVAVLTSEATVAMNEDESGMFNCLSCSCLLEVTSL